MRAAGRRGLGASSVKDGRRTRWCSLLNPMQERRKKFEENPRLGLGYSGGWHAAGAQGRGRDDGRCARGYGDVAGV